MNTLCDLILEADVYERFAGLFITDELRLARQRGEIAFYPRGRAIYYTEADLVAYVRSKRVGACKEDLVPIDKTREVPTEYSKSEASGSGKNVIRMSTPTTGTTPKHDELAARALESEI